MSKISKLIKTPNLYFKDALSKRFAKKTISLEAKKQIPKDIRKIPTKSLEKYSVDISKTKINLVVVDNSKANNKKDIVKFQLRSIEKYSNFSSISYISEHIVSSNKLVSTFKNYTDFYNEKILSIYPKNEVYVFVNLNFFFLRKVSHSNFINDSGQLITYFKKNKGKTANLDDIISKIIDGVNYNFTPMENFNIIDTMSLVYLDPAITISASKNDYLFKKLPIVNTILKNNILLDSPIQYAKLDAGYVEKFVWIQSVHGSKRCPLAITFDKDASNEVHYNVFLESLFPHSSSLENVIKTI